MSNIKLGEFEFSESWDVKYSPQTLDDMVLKDGIKTQIREQIDSKTKFCLLLSGKAGIGKTTLMNVVSNEINSVVEQVDGGLEGGVQTVHNKIIPFCDYMPPDGKQKILKIDEIDATSSSQENSFQKALRNAINNAQDTMFFATCNYPEKVLEPIISRLGGIITLSFTPKDLMKRLIYILDCEKIDYTRDDLKLFVEYCFKKYYPDIRSIVKNLQKHCSSGKLIVEQDTVSSNDISFLDKLVNYIKTEKDVLKIREYYLQNKSSISDYIQFGSQLFNYVLDNELLSDETCILKLSDKIYELNMVIDKEPIFFAFVVILKNYI